MSEIVPLRHCHLTQHLGANIAAFNMKGADVQFFKHVTQTKQIVSSFNDGTG